MDSLQQNVDFIINNPEVRAAAEQVRNEVNGVGITAETAAQRVAASVGRMATPQLGLIERLKVKLNEYQAASVKATDVTKLEQYNAKIQDIEREIQRLSRIGTQGFDDMGNKIKASMERPVGTLNRLVALQAIYARNLPLMTNPAQIERYNRKLQETELLIQRTRNAGRVGFDEVGNAVARSTNYLSRAWGVLRQIAYIVPGLGIAGIIGLLSEPIIAGIKNLGIFKKAISQIQENRKALNDVMAEGNKEAGKELTTLKVLYAAATDVTIPMKARIKAGEDLKKQFPEAFSNSKTIAILNGQEKKSYEDLTESILVNARAKAAKAKLDDIESKRLDIAFQKEKIQNANANEKITGARKYRRQVDQQDSLYTDAQKDWKMTEEQVKKQLQDNLFKPSDARAKEAIKVQDAQDKILKGQADFLTKYAGKEALAKAAGSKETPKATQTMLDHKAALQQKVTDLTNEYDRKSKEKDEAEIKSITDKFKKLSDEINLFNSNSKNKVKVDGSSLNSIRDNAIADLRYRQDVERTKIKLDQEKKLYQDFEEYRTILGDKAAKDRFGKQINTELTYAQYLEGLRGDLLSTDPTRMTGGQKEYLKWLDTQIRTEEETQAKADQTALKESQTFEEKKITLKDNFLKKLASLQGDANVANREELKGNYQDELDALISNNTAKSELSRRLAQEAIILTRTQIAEQIEILESSLNDVTIPDGFKEKIRSQINGLKYRLNIGSDQANLDTLKDRRVDIITQIGEKSKESHPDLTKLNKDLADINAQIYKLDKNGDGNVSGFTKFMDKLKDNKKLEGVATGLGLASDAAGMLSQGLGGVDTEAGYTLDTIGQLAGSAADLAGALISGDPAKMIGAAIKAVGTLFSIGKRVREMNLAARKEVADFYAQAIAGEREYQDLLKERALQTVKDNKTALQGIMDEIALRKSQTAEYSKEALEIMGKLQGMQSIASEEYVHGTWFRKAKVNKTYNSLQGKSFQELSQLLAQGKLEGDAKALVERLKELEQKGYDAERAMADLAKETNELFTGTNADTLTNSLADMFKEGKTGAQDLANFFKQSMDDAALSIFKNKVLAGAMDKFYAAFVAKTENGDITQSDYAELEQLFESLTADAKVKFEALKKLTGSSLSGASGGSAASTISKALTEDTASELRGLWRGVYDIEKQILNQTTVHVKNSNEAFIRLLQHNAAIEANTLNTVLQLKLAVIQLEAIAANSKAPMSTRGLGI